MKSSRIALIAAAILLAAALTGFGVAQAAGTDWNVEALDSYYVSQPDSEGIAQAGESDIQMENPVETGSLPVESNEDLDPFSRTAP